MIIAVTDLWTGSLSWSNTFLFINHINFFYISSVKPCNKFAQYSSLIPFSKATNESYPKKLTPRPSQNMELFSPSLEPILPFQSVVLTVFSSQMWSNGSSLHPWLWICAKTRLYCNETSPNTRLRHIHDAVLVSLSQTRCSCNTRLSHVQILVNKRLFEMPTMSASSCTFSATQFHGFSSPFLRGHLNWSTTATFALAYVQTVPRDILLL